MATKNRRVTTYLPIALDEKLKEYLSINPYKGESACLQTLLGMALSPAVDPSVLDRLNALERSIEALEIEVSKTNEKTGEK